MGPPRMKLAVETAAVRAAENCVGESRFYARARESFVAEVERGEHDDRCEYLTAPGFHLCHCSKRSREAAGHTAPPDDLEWVSPICPRCDEHVDHDGESWTCPRCRAYWASDGTSAEFYDDYGDLDKQLAELAERNRTASVTPAAPSTSPAVVDVELPAVTS